MVFKRGKFYQYRFSLHGKVHQKSTHQTNKDVAKNLETAERSRLMCINAGIETPFNSTGAKAITIATLLDRLKETYVRNGQSSPQNLSLIAKAKEDFGTWSARNLSTEQIDAYKDKMSVEGYSTTTTNRRLQALIRAFRGSGIKRPKIAQYDESGNVRQGYCTETQLAAVLANLPPHLRDFVEWCSITGQRRGEVQKLEWSMISADVLIIPASICKNGVARELPIIPELMEILERRRAVRTITKGGVTQLCPLIFHRGNGQAVPQFQRAWERATKAAGCPNLLLHDLRRFSVRNLLNAGVAVPLAKKWSGHRSDSMFYRYGILNAEDLRRSAAQVTEYRKQRLAEEQAKAAVAIR